MKHKILFKNFILIFKLFILPIMILAGFLFLGHSANASHPDHLWHFNECDGQTAADFIGSDDFNIGGNQWAFGKWNCGLKQYYSYDAAQVNFNQPINSNNLTLSFYYKFPYDNSRFYIRLFNEDNQELKLFLYGDHTKISGLPNSFAGGLGEGWPYDNQWHQVFLTIDGDLGEWKLYLDGIEFYSESKLIGPFTLPEFSKLEIEGDNNYNYIDEVALWQKTLSQAEIKTIYQSNQEFEPASPELPATPKKLLHLWNFDEGSGDVIHDLIGETDLSQNASWGEGKWGSGLHQSWPDNQNINGSLPDSINSRDVSIDFWWKNSSHPNEGRGAYYISGSQGNFGARLSYLHTNIYTPRGNINAPNIINDNEWHHIALVYDSYDYQLSFYVDAQLVYSGSALPLVDTEFNSIHFHGENSPYNIDEFAIWQGALSQQEIEDYYNSGQPHQEPKIDSLILQYEPILYLHPNETYQPMNVEAYVNHCSLWDSHGMLGLDELLKSESEENPVILSDLATITDSSDYYLQFSEDLLLKFPSPQKAETEYQKMKDNDVVKYSYYATRMIDKDEENNKEYIVLEYWFFYAFNNWKEKEGYNNHEGDWEVVMIFLDKATEQPKYIAYSSHYNKGQIEAPYFAQYASVRRSWDDPEVIKQGDHVVSFVGVGSHANFSNNGNNGVHPIPTPLFPDDRTSYEGLHLTEGNWQNIIEFKENNYPKWLTNYQGYWGVITGKHGFDGCSHPYPSQYERFIEPVKWAGVDKVGEINVWEPGITTLVFLEEKTELVFDQAVEIGTKVVVDLHDEIVELGSDLKELVFLPHFWDITSNLINDTFEAEVSFAYDTEETEAMGIEEEYLAVFLYDEDNKIWEKILSVTDISNKVISFFTTHFSRYALGAELWQDISEEVKVNKDWKRYDHKIGIKHINARVKNKTKANIFGDIRLIIKDINKEDVFLVNNTATTSEGYPYIEIKANDLYNHCIFTGDEEDIPEDLNKKGWLKKIIKKKMIRKKPLNRKTCEKIINKYPELEEKFEYTLLPHHYTKPIKLEFSLPIKKTKTIKYHGKEITIYIPEFRKFDFETEVLNKILEWE